METKLGPPEPREDLFFKNYKPPARDAITLPNHMIYFILATVVVFMSLYAIIRHLIIDLIHDLADWLLGEQPPEVMVSLWECKDKFKVDWCPETSPELEELARNEEVQVVMEGNKNVPAIWVISDAMPTMHWAQSGFREDQQNTNKTFTGAVIGTACETQTYTDIYTHTQALS